MGRPSLGGLSGLMQPRPPSDGGEADTVLAARADPRAASVPSGPGGEAATAALSQRGKPYVWGAKGPNSFDCSGLTQWAWAHAGVRLGPDLLLSDQGVPVDPGDVRAGDLISRKLGGTAVGRAMRSSRSHRPRSCMHPSPAMWSGSWRCPALFRGTLPRAGVIERRKSAHGTAN